MNNLPIIKRCKKRNPNNRLYSRIVLKYHDQTVFAKVLKCSVSKVSKTINRRTELMDSEKLLWAKKLECEVGDIF